MCVSNDSFFAMSSVRETSTLRGCLDVACERLRVLLV